MSLVTEIHAVVHRFLVRDEGATLAEYGVALIVAIVIGASTMSFLADAVGDEIAETASAF